MGSSGLSVVRPSHSESDQAVFQRYVGSSKFVDFRKVPIMNCGLRVRLLKNKLNYYS
jgi:hypothetical protein